MISTARSSGLNEPKKCTFENMSIKEFRPTILFLIKFLGIYLLANLLYGLYINSCYPHPDSITHVVSEQTGIVLNMSGYRVEVEDRAVKPTTDIVYFNKAALSIYEGCNGINVMIIFVAFLFAFGPIARPLTWFIPLGLTIIHLANLCRIVLLFLVSQYMPRALYFTHKYFFTAILYVVVFALWGWWVRYYSLIRKK